MINFLYFLQKILKYNLENPHLHGISILISLYFYFSNSKNIFQKPTLNSVEIWLCKSKAENLRVDRPKKIPFVFPVCFKHLSNICFKYKYTLTWYKNKKKNINNGTYMSNLRQTWRCVHALFFLYDQSSKQMYLWQI